MRKIFLDVGGHLGQTLEEITKPVYHFDLIYCFEPMPREFALLQARYGQMPKVVLRNHGLADSSGNRPIYGTNADMGASIYRTKADLDDPDVVTECSFVRVSDFFRAELEPDDLAVMKLNCEGSETIILNDLLDSGEIEKIANVMINFDVRKIPDRAGEERALLERFREAGFTRYSKAEDVMHGPTHQARIRDWIFSLDFHEQVVDLF